MFAVKKSCLDNNPCSRNSDKNYKSLLFIKRFLPARVSDGHLHTGSHLTLTTIPGVGALGPILQRRRLGLREPE